MVSKWSLLRLGLLIKLPSYARILHSFLDRQTKVKIGYRNRTIFFLYSFVLLVIHLLACFWYMIGDDSPKSSWFNVAKASFGNITTKPIFTKYLYSIYWAIVTITTTGYGDITALRSSEMAFIVIVLLLAAVTNAAIIGSIAVTAEHSFKKNTKYDIVKDVLDCYL